MRQRRLQSQCGWPAVVVVGGGNFSTNNNDYINGVCGDVSVNPALEMPLCAIVLPSTITHEQNPSTATY